MYIRHKWLKCTGRHWIAVCREFIEQYYRQEDISTAGSTCSEQCGAKASCSRRG